MMNTYTSWLNNTNLICCRNTPEAECAPCLDLSYIAVLFAHLIYSGKVQFIEGPFTLGRFSKPMNILTITWVLFIATTIRLSAFARRRETGIMRLVGASNAFIQLPFLLEGVIAAAIGATLSAGALGLLVHFGVSGWLQDQATGFNLVSGVDVLIVAPILIAIGVVMAGASSLITLNKYTKV